MLFNDIVGIDAVATLPIDTCATVSAVFDSLKYRQDLLAQVVKLVWVSISYACSVQWYLSALHSSGVAT